MVNKSKTDTAKKIDPLLEPLFAAVAKVSSNHHAELALLEKETNAQRAAEILTNVMRKSLAEPAVAHYLLREFIPSETYSNEVYKEYLKIRRAALMAKAEDLREWCKTFALYPEPIIIQYRNTVNLQVDGGIEPRLDWKGLGKWMARQQRDRARILKLLADDELPIVRIDVPHPDDGKPLIICFWVNPWTDFSQYPKLILPFHIPMDVSTSTLRLPRYQEARTTLRLKWESLRPNDPLPDVLRIPRVNDQGASSTAKRRGRKKCGISADEAIKAIRQYQTRKAAAEALGIAPRTLNNVIAEKRR